MSRIKQWMDFLGKKNLIAIGALLVLVIAISVGIAILNSKSDKKVNDEVEESSGLQVEENADDVEGDSIDFSEFQTEDEKKNEQEGNNKTQSGNNGQSGNDGQGESGSGSGNGGLTESPSDGDNGDGDNGDGGNGGTTSSSPEFGPFF